MLRRPLLSAFFVAAACFMPSVAQTVDADSLRAALMAEEMAMNAPGRMAADFRLMLADGAESRLSHFRGAPLLLVLFDPDCDDCLRALDKLPEKVPHGMAVLAVYADGDMSVWRGLWSQCLRAGPPLSISTAYILRACIARNLPPAYICLTPKVA